MVKTRSEIEELTARIAALADRPWAQGLLRLWLEELRDRVETEELTAQVAALADRPWVREVTRLVLEELSARELRERRPVELAGAVTGLLELAGTRPARTHRLQIVDLPTADGGPARHAFLQVVTDDMPFLVSSLSAVLGRREVRIHQLAYPRLGVKRDGDGRLLELSPGQRGEGSTAQAATSPVAHLESWIHLEIDRLPTEAARVELEDAIDRVLLEVRRVVEDWRPMRGRLEETLEELDRSALSPSPESEEGIAFLRWLGDDHFIFLGCRDDRLEPEEDQLFLRPLPGTGLGILSEVEGPPPAARRPLPPALQRHLQGERLVRVGKSRERARVHRDAPMDRVGVKLFDDQGKPVGERLFLGLFTSRAYELPASSIPLLRRKLARVTAWADLYAARHDARLVRQILENYPRDELFQLSEEDLQRATLQLLELQLRPRAALLVRRDEEEGYLSCLVHLPREEYGDSLRSRILRLMEDAFAGRVTASDARLSDAKPLARLHLILTPTGEAPARPDLDELEARLQELATPWGERLEEPLGVRFGWQVGRELHRRYRHAFPVAYQQVLSPQEAAADVELIERVLTTGCLGIRLELPGAEDRRLRLRIFEGSRPTPLSRVLLRLENMGLEVSADVPFEVRPEGAQEPVWGRDFEAVAAADVFPESAAADFEEALGRVWSGEVENDGFNRLVLVAGLTWRQVVVLRACCRYLRQVGVAFSAGYLADTLVRHPATCRLLIALFETLFDPDREDDRGARTTELLAQIREQIDRVQSLDEDRILRRLLNLIQHTLRTNYFQPAADGSPKAYLSLKLDPTRLFHLPRPRPPLETFVYSPRTEAVHLRADKAARGGIRWSDRREDFRTEILGLFKAQMVKNTTIVAVGAKGGFVIKGPLPREREALLAEGIECYRTMIRGLLDLTDDLRDGEVVPPPRVVRRDGDDPYLVVAADKGTATFSDVANGVAHEYGYWLGDAFASGGSAGYDHKQMAITARGAWESVQRHFRELGKDVQNEGFTVIGVGDMSGDVFGNGMLLSRHLKLVGAFNHLHVFIDPDPDPEASWAERRRLFDFPRSTWADYDRSLISAGGGVFERSAKVVELSPQVRQLLALDSERLPPAELIRALLRAPVDLLWFGGIGTYVKVADESHQAIGDRVNDELRIDAGELRARVIGEGANLALTQAARVEHALHGGRLNTDFLDNSGGVQCSDLEVNVKIVLETAQARGELARAERDPILVEITDEVAARVLRTNYEQTQAVSLAVFRGHGLLAEQRGLIRHLEARGALDRYLESLPDDAALEQREAAGLGLTRPEVAVLLAYAKMVLYGEILASELPDDPYLEAELVGYFPPTLGQRFRAAIREHRLRREIVTSRLTCAVTHRMGPTFAHRLAEESGRSGPEVARCFVAARDVLGSEELWRQVDALDNRVPAAVQTTLHLEIAAALSQATLWLLVNGTGEGELDGLVARFRPVAAEVAAGLDRWAPGERRSLRRRAFVRTGVPEEVAGPITALEDRVRSFDVALLAERTARPVAQVASLLYAAEESFGLYLVPVVKSLATPEGAQERGILSEAEGNLHRFRHRLLERVLVGGDAAKELAALREHGQETACQLAELTESPAPDPVLLLAISRRLLDLGAAAAVN